MYIFNIRELGEQIAHFKWEILQLDYATPGNSQPEMTLADHENEHLSSDYRQLLHSEIHRCVCAVAMLLTGSSPSVTTGMAGIPTQTDS